MLADKSNKQVIMAAFIAALLCGIVYTRALSCGFINWDDHLYVINNASIRNLDGVVEWAFTSSYLGWWMPLIWISFAFDYYFWGLDPFGYHLTNIVLHAVNAALVVLLADKVLRRCLKPESLPHGRLWYFVALLLAGLFFGIHPLRVESVAWVTERKDVLNGMFALASAFFYFRFLQYGENGDKKGVVIYGYIMSLLFFALSLMAKSVTVVLPLLFLLADWHLYGRMRKGNILPVLLEKIPFILLSVVMVVLTVWLAYYDDSLLDGITIWQRLIISGNALFEYSYLMLFPVGIVPLYAIPIDFARSYTIKTAVVVAFTIFSLLMVNKKPVIVATWLGFVILLLPTMAFTQNGMQAYAARFTYLPSVVVSIVVAAALAKAFAREPLINNRSLRWFAVVAILAIVVWYASMTQRLIAVWQDSGAYWSRIIALQPFDVAYYYRGLYYLDSGKYGGAIDDFTVCIADGLRQKRADVSNVYALRGEAFVKSGRYSEAVEDLNFAIKTSAQPVYYYFRGMARLSLGELKQAREDFDKAGV